MVIRWKPKPQADNDAVLGILYANFGCFALLTGHKLGVFELLATEPLTASEVASKLELANRPAKILLTTLVAQRFWSNPEAASR
jgi:hypothetical protein